MAECTESEVRANEPSDDPAYENWIGVFQVREEFGTDLYVKIALSLPDLSTGMFVSFHLWGRGR